MIAMDAANGVLIEDSHFEIFFGNKTFSALVDASQEHELFLLKQVHGCAVVPAASLVISNAPLIEADGHWTTEANKSLAIKTADCLPILITSAQHGLVAALHAGWRGVEQRITSHFLSSRALAADSSLRLYIGPHIQQKSFEVDLEVAERVLSAHKLTLAQARTDSLCVSKNKKYYISLSELVVREAQTFGISRQQIWVSDIDTKTNPQFFSYRRLTNTASPSGETAVRNYSVVRRRGP